MVRSVEQQYWTLNMAAETFMAWESALNLCEEMLQREEAEPENMELMDRFPAEFLQARTEVVTADRQFRRILGLPKRDNRRIVPITPMRTEKVAFNVENCLAEKLAMHADFTDVIVASFFPENASARSPAKIAAMFDLTRMVGHVDMNYCGYETARKLKSLAKDRLDCVLEEYEKGTASAEHLMEEAACWATAAAQEVEYGALYNTSIAAVEEMKGSLLKARDIQFAGESRVVKVEIQGKLTSLNLDECDCCRPSGSNATAPK